MGVCCKVYFLPHLFVGSENDDDDDYDDDGDGNDDDDDDDDHHGDGGKGSNVHLIVAQLCIGYLSQAHHLLFASIIIFLLFS